MSERMTSGYVCVFVWIGPIHNTHRERRDLNACVKLSYGNVTKESKCDSTEHTLNPVSIHKHKFTWHNSQCTLLLTQMSQEQMSARWSSLIQVCIVYLIKKITTAKHKAREKGRKREKKREFSGERKRVCGREQKARIVREPNTEISFFFPVAIYKNIYRRSFDCVGSELMLCKSEHFRFISMVTFHGTKMLLPWNIKTNQSHFY